MRATLSAAAVGAIMLATPSFTRASARDLARYETRGPFVLHEHVISAEDRALIHAQMREFFLDCWQQHRLGRLITIGFSMEGLPTRTTYFIEPDEKGAWHVVIETTTTSRGVKLGTDEHYTEDFTTIATLETVNASDGKKHIRITSGGKTLLDL
jgi:hypothetical protein